MALTEKQRLFVDALCDAMDGGVKFNEAFNAAKSFAGYSESTVKRDIITDDVAQEIQSHYNKLMILKLSKASNAVDSLLEEPDQNGAAVLLATANSVLDRGGVIKKESKEITIKAPTGIVVMPSKSDLDPE